MSIILRRGNVCLASIRICAAGRTEHSYCPASTVVLTATRRAVPHAAVAITGPPPTWPGARPRWRGAGPSGRQPFLLSAQLLPTPDNLPLFHQPSPRPPRGRLALYIITFHILNYIRPRPQPALSRCCCILLRYLPPPPPLPPPSSSPSSRPVPTNVCVYRTVGVGVLPPFSFLFLPTSFFFYLLEGTRGTLDPMYLPVSV